MQNVQTFMEWLNAALPVVNSSWFYSLFAIAALANPVAVWVQVYKAWTADGVDGLSSITFAIMFTLQLLTVGYAIAIEDFIIMLVMVLSALGSLAILVAIFFRKNAVIVK